MCKIHPSRAEWHANQAAIEAADLESPEQVADLVLEVARKRGDWRAKLAACAAIG